MGNNFWSRPIELEKSYSRFSAESNQYETGNFEKFSNNNQLLDAYKASFEIPH